MKVPVTCSFLNWCVLHSFWTSLKIFPKTPVVCFGDDEINSSTASTSCPSTSGLEFGAEPFSPLAGGVLDTLPTWNNARTSDLTPATVTINSFKRARDCLAMECTSDHSFTCIFVSSFVLSKVEDFGCQVGQELLLLIYNCESNY